MSSIFDQIEENEYTESLFENDDSVTPFVEDESTPTEPSKKELKKLTKQKKKEEKQLAKQRKKEEKQLAKQKKKEKNNNGDLYGVNDVQSLFDEEFLPEEDFIQPPVEEVPQQVEEVHQTVQPQVEEDMYIEPENSLFEEDGVQERLLAKPTKPKKERQPKQKKTKSKSKAKKGFVISTKPKTLNVKCTEPRFRKEEIHSQTIPHLEVDILALHGDSSPLYMDELKQLEEQETYIPPQDVEEDTSYDYVPQEPNFDTEDFLSNLTPVEDSNIVFEEITEESIEEIPVSLDEDDISLPDINDLPDNIESIPQDLSDVSESLPNFEDIQIVEVEEPVVTVPVEEEIPIIEPEKPTLDIKETDINLEDGVLDFGSSSAGNKEQTSITFDKEAFLNIAERVK